MKIIVKSAQAATRQGVGDGGRPWKIVEQTAYAEILDKEGKPEEYPQKITLRVEDGEQPYAVGEYALSDQSFYVGQYGKLTVGRVVLVPFQVARAVKTA